MQKSLKFIVPIAIVAIIGGIWFVKNAKPTEPIPFPGPINADFALEDTTLDLAKLKSYGLPIMIDFGADSCMPCKRMAPVLIDVNAQFQGKVIVKFYDVWKTPSVGNGYPMEVIPTQFFFDSSGEPYMPKDAEKMQMNIHKDSTGKHIYTSHIGALTKKQMLEIFAEMGVEL